MANNMKRYSVYVEDIQGFHTWNGINYTYITQIKATDNNGAKAGVECLGLNKGKSFIVKYSGKAK